MQLRKLPFILIFCVYALVVLINLNKIPVAWVDEIMIIDPAWNWMNEGKFIGKVWPHEGSEIIFLAYLPLSSFIHIIELSIFPHELFYTRILWFIFLIITCIYLFKYIDKRYQSLPAGILFLLTLFIFDEGISNAMRSGRVEMPILALLASLFYLALTRKHPIIQSILIALLLISHPGIYPIALIFIIELLTRKSTPINRAIYLLVILSLPIFYLSLSNFNIESLYNQLILHGQEHDGHDQTNNWLYQHFIQRFLPTYQFQFYILILNLIVHVSCVYTLIVKKNYRLHLVEISFLATSIFWFFSLAPFYRYSSILLLLMFMHLPELYKRVLSLAGFLRISFRAAKIWQLVFMFSFIGLVSTPFIVRNTAAIKQYEVRDEYRVYDWLDSQIKIQNNQKILIIDEPIAFFYSMNRPHVHYTLPYAIHKFSFSDFDKVYYLTHRKNPIPQKLIGIYLENKANTFNLFNTQKIITYQGMHLYEIQSEEEMQSLKRN